MSATRGNAISNRLRAFIVALKCAKPRTVIVTTPNIEYNVRFEWTRAEFQAWANGVAERFGYTVRFAQVGPEDHEVGSPTQMGVLQHG